MNGGANVVMKTRERQLCGATTAAHGGFCFENENGTARLSKHDGCGKAVRTGTHHNRVVTIH